MGVLLPFDEAAILYRDFNSAPSQKQNIIVFAANNSMCCECHVAPTILLIHAVSADQSVLMCSQHGLVSATKTENSPLLRSLEQYMPRIGSADQSVMYTCQHRLVGADCILQENSLCCQCWQHRLVGATCTSAPTSRCFQCLQKNIFAHFYGRLVQRRRTPGCASRIRNIRTVCTTEYTE